MKRTTTTLALLLAPMLAAATPTATTDDPIHRAEVRGTQMFWYDRAAWVTTDDMLAKLPIDRRTDVGGWIVSPAAGQHFHVDYIGKGAASRRVIYSANVYGQSLSNVVVSSRGMEPPLGGAAARMLSALVTARQRLATHADWQPCTAAPFNTVVLPPDEHGIVATYFLSAMKQNGQVPLGGHFEIDVAADGSIAFERRFTQGCLTMANASDASAASAAYVNHILDPRPTEVHVFQQYALGVPLYVAAGGAIWLVDGGHISRVRGDKAPPI